MTLFGRDLTNDEKALQNIRTVLECTRFKRSDNNYHHFAELIGKDLGDSISLSQLSLYPQIDISIIQQALSSVGIDAVFADLETALADLLYHGYIKVQQNSQERVFHNDGLKIPSNINYRQISGLSHEMIERLERARPQNFGQVRRLPGLTPTAVATLLFNLKTVKTA